MRFFDNLFGGSQPSSSGKGIQQIIQFCSQLGWRIDDRTDSSIAIPFRTQIGSRHLIVSVGETGKIGVAGMCSGIERPPGQLHQMAAPYLLVRNSEMSFGAWKMKQSGNNLAFEVQYMFLAEAVTAAVFKSIGEMLANEVGEAISFMSDKGWL